MSSAEDRREGANPEHYLERLVKQVFESQVKYSEDLLDDDRAAIVSLFGLLTNRSKITKHQAKIGAPLQQVAAYEQVTLV